MFRKAKLLILTALVTILPCQVFAIGLGEVHLITSLNEPLNAEIQLLQVKGLSENEILVGIAPKADFEAAGVDRLFFLSSLKFSLELDNPKGPLIRIRTDAPVREPYLNFLLEVQWPNGRLLREYTLLMDLPTFKDSQSSAHVIKGAQAPTIHEQEKPKPAPLDVQALEKELAAVDATPVVIPAAPAANAPSPQAQATPQASSQLEETPVEKGAAPQAATKEAEQAPAPVEETKPAAAEEKPGDAAKPAEESAMAEEPVAPKEAAAAPQTNSSQSVVPVYSSTPAEGDYTTHKGDSLWAIAMKYNQQQGGCVSREYQCNGISVQQSMLAIQRLNPQAFMKSNINLLKKGKVMRMPTYDDLTDMTSREAVAEVRRQNIEWSGNADGRKNAAPSEQIDATHQEVATTEAPSAVEEGHLKLSVPGATDGSATGKASGAAAGSTEALQNELSITMEELDRNKREKTSVTNQLSGLDDQTKTMQQMLDVRSAELAALQATLAKKEQTANETQGASITPAGQEGEVSDKTVLSEQNVEKAIENEKPAATPAPVEAPAAPVAETKPAVEEKSGILAQLQANLIYIGGGLLTLLLLVFAVIKLRNRKPSTELALQDETSDTETDALDEETSLDDIDDVASTLEDSLEMEEEPFEEPAVESKPETSDAIGEADIYISFGTYDKAESLLKNAIAAEPKRADLRLKLLEVYVGMENLQAFDKQFSELKGLNDAGATERAHEMRNKISGASSEDSISSAPTAVTAAVSADDLDFDLDLDDKATADLDLDLADHASDSVSKSDDSLDFDLDLDLDLDEEPRKEDPTQKSPKVSMNDAPTVQQRAIDISEMQTAVSPAIKVAEARTETRDSLDLDLSGLDAELEAFDSIESTPTAITEAVATDTPTPETGLDEEFDFLADADEAATKLDLARAYIDMGDKEGAKDILQEVIEEGQDAQKNEARKLLEGIS